MNAISLDATDCRILTVLQQEGRISNLDLAERISLSPSACLRRLRLLEEQGVIERYRACLNREVLGFELEAFVQVSMRNDQQNWHETFAEALRDWPEVVGAFVVTGETHYLLRVLAHNLKHYSDFVLQRLYKAPGVMDIRSNIVLQTLKEDSGVPVALVPGAGVSAVAGTVNSGAGVGTSSGTSNAPVSGAVSGNGTGSGGA